jgi:hypothetical protein
MEPATRYPTKQESSTLNPCTNTDKNRGRKHASNPKIKEVNHGQTRVPRWVVNVPPFDREVSRCRYNRGVMGLEIRGNLFLEVKVKSEISRRQDIKVKIEVRQLLFDAHCVRCIVYTHGYTRILSKFTTHLNTWDFNVNTRSVDRSSE